ncbi:MAG: aminotransferase class I/II-fold pyridoxal phosphate-dependent enzyme, partial [Cyclobacteriaceae bacterium]
MEQLSERIKAMEESATIAMAQKARELKSQGIDVISLSLGEPDFKTPEHICQAAKEAIDEGKYFTYTPVPGYLDLRQAIAEKLKNENQLDYSPEQIVVSTGAKQSIANVMMCLLNPGDEVIVYAPYWVSYVEIIKLAEGVPVAIDGSIENNFKATAEQLKKAISPKTKAVIFSSPCNPTGAVFSREELQAMAEVLKDHPDISEATRNKIKEYAMKVNYRPNALALSLKQQKSKTIGIVIPEIIHHFFSSIISGIEDIAYNKGYRVMICQSNEDHQREEINVQALLDHRVDGMLVCISKNTTQY